MSVAKPQIARGAYHLSPTDRECFVIGTDHVCRLGARIVGGVLIEVTDDVPHLLPVLDNLRRLARGGRSAHRERLDTTTSRRAAGMAA